MEIDPETNTVVWNYSDARQQSFYSHAQGGAQRLPNGNTLVTEAWFGRLFQVTPEGEVVWEFINPCFTQREGREAFSNMVFRARHYLPQQVPRV